MDAEPVTPDAFLIFCPEVAPRPSDRLPIRAIASFRFADRTHPWPIRAHPASLSNMLPFPTSSSHPRGGPKQRVQLCHRDVPTCAEHPKASLTSRFVSSGNLAGESLVWNATIALAKTCRSWFSLVKPLANETHHQNDRRHCDDTFPTGPLPATNPPKTTGATQTPRLHTAYPTRFPVSFTRTLRRTFTEGSGPKGPCSPADFPVSRTQPCGPLPDSAFRSRHFRTPPRGRS